jgi:hypothetical protein
VRFVREGARYVVHDMGSTNGTFLGGERIRKHVLRHGDRIHVGRVSFIFRTDEPGIITGVRRCGEWLGFNPWNEHAMHAVKIGGDAADIATLIVGLDPVTDLRGFPKQRAQLEGAVVVDDCAGLSWPTLARAQQQAGTASAEDLRVALGFLFATANAGVEAHEERVTFDGRLVSIAPRHGPTVTLPQLARLIGARAFDLDGAMGGDDEELRFIVSAAAHWWQDGMGQLVDAARRGDGPGLLRALTQLSEHIGGTPSAGEMRGVLRGLCATDVAHEESLREQVAILGADGLARMLEPQGKAQR